MTGGAELAGTINRNLAQAAQKLGIGLMLGSQRIMLGNDPASTAAAVSFQVRDLAPDVLLIGNIGLAQLAGTGGVGRRGPAQGLAPMHWRCTPALFRRPCRKPATPTSCGCL